MNYPVWELDLGGGLLIAVVSILHVFVSHFAIGGGLFLVITEHLAYRRGDVRLENYLATHSRFFALVSLVFGAVSGVGIWFAIGLVSPAATSALIRTFVWGWAIEWVFFLVEIAAAIVYYSTWRRVSRRTHLAVGWVYFAAAFLSLVVINGIITFMLTPGDWVSERTFSSGFFNPTYWPSLFTRTAICIALAGVYALVTASRVRRHATRFWLLRYAAVWALAGLLIAVPSALWYGTLLPGGGAELMAGAQPLAATAARVLTWGTLGLVLVLLAPLLIPKQVGIGTAIIVALLALASFGAAEAIRESARKPFVIVDYMYGNGLRIDESAALAESGGLLANALWTENREASATATVGKEVFRVACRNCHTIDGYRGLREPLLGLDEDFVYELVGRSEYMRGRMPRFAGNEVELRALARYLVQVSNPNLAMIDGDEVFGKRCGFCHTRDGYRALYGSLEGSTEEEIRELLLSLSDLSEGMPPWSGNERDTELLVEYIASWYAVPDEK